MATFNVYWTSIFNFVFFVSLMSTSSQAVFPPVPPTAAVAVPAVFLRRRRFGLLRACASLDFAAVAVGSHRKHADVRSDFSGGKSRLCFKHPEILGYQMLPANYKQMLPANFDASTQMFIKYRSWCLSNFRVRKMLPANIGVQSSTCWLYRQYGIPMGKLGS